MPHSSSTYRLWLWVLPVPLAVALLSACGAFDRFEQWTIDLRFRARGEIAAQTKVAYVDVDSRSISDLGNQPWDRAYFAEVAEALLSHGQAKVVGIDYVFSDNGVPDLVDQARFDSGRLALAEYLNQTPAPPVVVAASYAAPAYRDLNQQMTSREFPRVGTPVEQASLPELPEFRIANLVFGAPHIGLIDTIEGETRAVHAFAEVGELRWNHMAVELARLYWGVPREGVQRLSNALEFRKADGTLIRRVPLREGQDVSVNWFSRWDSPAHHFRASFSQALVCARVLRDGGTDEEKAICREFFNAFKDAVVLIGPVDPLLHDLSPTPLDRLPVPRVGIHGNLFKTIVEDRFLREPSGWESFAWVIVITLAVAGAALRPSRRAGLWRWVSVGAAVAFVAVAYLLFRHYDWIVPVVAPLASALAATLVGLVVRVAIEERQKRRIQGLFGTYLSPELVERMVDSGEEPRLGGQEVEITAYFSDIENFTTLSEGLSPKALVELMNEYLTECTDAVTQAGGTLDKYIGDAVVAMYGAPVMLPDHAWRACTAAARVQERLQALRARWQADTARWPGGPPRLNTRIGLASGPAVVGNMGSTTRFNYTMMGDTVNLAARLESAAKLYGAGILAAEGTRNQCIQTKDTLLFRPLDRLQVKGRSLPVLIYELVGRREALPAQTLACIDTFSRALEAYWRRDFARASQLFADALKDEPNELAQPGLASPSRVYLGRSRHFEAQPPPEDWTGVWVQTQK